MVYWHVWLVKDGYIKRTMIACEAGKWHDVPIIKRDGWSLSWIEGIHRNLD
jgi:hypothetical protein